jgi:hypothetical protein
MAEQRDFLLSRAGAPYAHFLDGDVLLERPVMERMLGVIRREGCGLRRLRRGGPLLPGRRAPPRAGHRAVEGAGDARAADVGDGHGTGTS